MLKFIAADGPEDFAWRMKTGSATGRRTVGRMTAVSQENRSQLTEPEIACLQAFPAAARG